MDYYQNYNSLKDNMANEDTTSAGGIIPPYQFQPSYPCNDEFQRQTTNNNEMQIIPSTIETDIFNNGLHDRQEPMWNSHNVLGLTANEIINCNNSEDLIQPERGIAGFVSKLYQCLQAPDDGHKYARWCRHNGIDMFIIDCIPKFTETVLPRLFKHCKFASFVRQLNIYGFQRDTDARKSKDSRDKETCRWHHIHFRPGRRDLFHLIRRKTPRYSRSRRKRLIRDDDEDEEEGETIEDDDPETILNIGSGDDDEIENSIIFLDNRIHNNNIKERRRSTSEASSSITTLQHQNTVNIDYNKSGELNLMYESPQHGFDSYIHLAQAQSSPISSSPVYNQFSSNNNNIVPLSMATPNGPDINKTGPCEILHIPQTIQEQQPQSDEEQLRSEIEQLRRGYARMYKTLCGEVNKAVSLIEIQRTQIEYLENAIQESNNQHQQMQLRQHVPLVETAISNNYFSNSNSSDVINGNSGSLYHQSSNVTPVTPIYPQQHILQQQPNPQLHISNSNQTVHHDGFEFLFSDTRGASIDRRTENSLKIPITTASDRWLSATPTGASIQRLQQQRRSSGVVPMADS